VCEFQSDGAGAALIAFTIKALCSLYLICWLSKLPGTAHRCIACLVSWFAAVVDGADVAIVSDVGRAQVRVQPEMAFSPTQRGEDLIAAFYFSFKT
jgi:hypothetical protein